MEELSAKKLSDLVYLPKENDKQTNPKDFQQKQLSKEEKLILDMQGPELEYSTHLA